MSGVDKAASDGVELQVQLSRCFVAGRGEAAPSPRISFYIDALNLYYGALRHTPYRWLDIKAFCGALLREKAHFNIKTPGNLEIGDSKCIISGIKIFTAPLKELPWDRDAPKRQKLYYTALAAHNPDGLIKVVNGKFKTNKVIAHDAAHTRQKHRVFRPEEKGSDVNLALHMLNDAVDDVYDCAIMVSNDTDLLEALTMVHEREKVIGAAFPVAEGRRVVESLKESADFYLKICPKMLAASQLPDIVCRKKGNPLRKPELWKRPRKGEKWDGAYGRDFCADKCGYCFAPGERRA